MRSARTLRPYQAASPLCSGQTMLGSSGGSTLSCNANHIRCATDDFAALICRRRRYADDGRPGTRQKHPSFAKAKHALLEQWDGDRNRENGNFTGNTTLQSQKLIWWPCHACPMGREHSWQARAASRTSRKHKTGCPFCAGHKLCECNSLETVYPDVAADFDVQNNGLSASEVTNSTSTKYSWLSDEPGAKKRAVNDRIRHARRRSPQLIDTNDL